MNYADIKKTDVANGTGVRVSVFVSGCTHCCEGCFNKETWDFNYGSEFTQDTVEKVIEYVKPDYISGLSLLGGEPFERSNQQGLLPLLRRFRELYPKAEYERHHKNVWAYSGYLFDKDIVEKMCSEWEETKEFLSYIDIIVDGEFIEDKKSLNLHFKGSSNQRTILVDPSLDKKSIVLMDENSY